MASLTTHVLDTAQGIPAQKLCIHLSRRTPTGYQHLKTIYTNSDGRADAPLLGPDDGVSGHYELVFCVGAYFAASGLKLAEPAFLDEVPVRFAIANESGHYHVPLLVSPWGYTTYRGS
jgi:5-hydroxyisourate hydrolase